MDKKKQATIPEIEEEETIKIDENIKIDEDGYSDELMKEGNEDIADAERDTLSSEAPYMSPESLGQQDPEGGSEPAPTGEDVGEMARRYGLDYDRDNNGEGYENDELNTAEQIDQAEKRIQES